MELAALRSAHAWVALLDDLQDKRHQMKRTILLSLLLAGCATSPSKVPEAWYGASYDDLVARWGKPTGSGKAEDGSEMHTWRSELAGGYSYPTGPSVSVGVFGSSRGGGAGVGIGVPIGGPPPPPAPQVCERRMIFRDGRVADQVWSGDPGYCETFKR